MTVDELYDDIDFLVTSNSVSYTPANKLRNMNIAYQNVAAMIWEVAEGWQYDDSNATDFAIATATLVDAQQDYEIPSTAQRLERVEVLDSQGNYQKLTQRDIHEIDLATSEYYETDGLPLYYDLVGRSIFLYPGPSTTYVTAAAGLKVYFSRDVIALDETTDTPGFATAFHRLLSLSAAIDYSKNRDEHRHLVDERDRTEKSLKRFYGHRNVERRSAIRPAGKRRWRNYI